MPKGKLLKNRFHNFTVADYIYPLKLGIRLTFKTEDLLLFESVFNSGLLVKVKRHVIYMHMKMAVLWRHSQTFSQMFCCTCSSFEIAKCAMSTIY